MSHLLSCELSGQRLDAGDAAVVTPSGHICSRPLLLKKLAENGGLDPFLEDVPLQEEQLVTLQPLQLKQTPPPSSGASFTGLLEQVHHEYDAVLLELIETRQALQQTRQELSLALYQNDAAIRVVARLANERDAARQELAHWQATAVPEPAHKKRRVEETTTTAAADQLPLKNDIPDTDLQEMISTWESLHKNRRAMLKQIKAASEKELKSWDKLETKSWHKDEGITAMAYHDQVLVTTGQDKQLVVYDTAQQEVQHKIALDETATSVNMNEQHIVMGTSSGKVSIWSRADMTLLDTVSVNDTTVVDVRLHPDNKHLLALCANGTVVLIRLQDKATVITVFEPQETTQTMAGALHPDGLIYVAGNAQGELVLWDLKSKSLAGQMSIDQQDAVQAVNISNNGYHIAVAHASGTVRIWDLRKQKVIATFNDNKDKLETVESVCFDPSGKYVALGGKDSVKIASVKSAKIVSQLACPASRLVWGNADSIAAASHEAPQVTFFGNKQDS